MIDCSLDREHAESSINEDHPTDTETEHNKFRPLTKYARRWMAAHRLVKYALLDLYLHSTAFQQTNNTNLAFLNCSSIETHAKSILCQEVATIQRSKTTPRYHSNILTRCFVLEYKHQHSTAHVEASCSVWARTVPT